LLEDLVLIMQHLGMTALWQLGLGEFRGSDVVARLPLFLLLAWRVISGRQCERLGQLIAFEQ